MNSVLQALKPDLHRATMARGALSCHVVSKEAVVV